MKEREVYASLRVLSPIIIRIDGRSFHTLTDRFIRPFDEHFATVMAEVSRDLLERSDLGPRFAYTFSDEINLYFDEIPFSGRIEKLDSVVASYAASAFTLRCPNSHPIAFDSRVIPITEDIVCSYLLWRQQEAWRNHNNAYSQHVLRENGLLPDEISLYLHGKCRKDLHEICFTHGINLAKTPAWQRRGVLIYKKTIEKEAYDPRNGARGVTYRKKVVIDRDIPLFSTQEGEELIHGICGL
ncbi:MAG: tRNA 5'-guanylyltransferase [Methanomicrobiales archaeon]|jgi:tRNA(His) 5'-end guanylyltransferase|nr:tRNA 5'-guanylyltransferase [Methanomicrobiales archaeon]